MSTMKAALLTTAGEALEFTDVTRPEPGPGQVLVKLQSCGVCHSDVHYWKGEDAIPEGREHVILGHEGVGTIAGNGEGTSITEGTRVGIGFVYSACGECRECRTGGETYCQNSQATGVHVDGCFAEYIVAPESWVTRIPESLDSAEAAPPALRRRHRVQRGQQGRPQPRQARSRVRPRWRRPLCRAVRGADRRQGRRN